MQHTYLALNAIALERFLSSEPAVFVEKCNIPMTEDLLEKKRRKKWGEREDDRMDKGGREEEGSSDEESRWVNKRKKEEKADNRGKDKGKETDQWNIIKKHSIRSV